MNSKRWRIVSASVAGTLLGTATMALIIIYTGAYNVSAATGHAAITRWLLETVMRQSVGTRADTEPPQFTKAMLEAGAGEYKSMCQQCHGGPGVTRADWAKGLVPQPPDLSSAATKWDPGEVHWIVKNGIKMTAMPAFGETHDSETIWNIAAFVEQLPRMSPKEYSSFSSGYGHSGAGTSPQSGHGSPASGSSSDGSTSGSGHTHQDSEGH